MWVPEENECEGSFSLSLYNRDFTFTSDVPDFMERCLRLHYGDMCSPLSSAPPTEKTHHLDICMKPAGSDFSVLGEITEFPILDEDSKYTVAFDSNKICAVASVGGKDFQELSRQYFSAICTFIQLCLKMDGMFVFHASSVVLNGKGILIPGTNGSGKSTTMRKLLEMGAEYLSDDSAIISHEGETVKVSRNPELMNISELTGDVKEKLLIKGFSQMPDGYFYAPPAEIISAPVSLVIFPGLMKESAPPVSLTKKGALIKLFKENKTPLTRDDYENFLSLCGKLAENSVATEFYIGRNKEFPAGYLEEICEKL